MMRRDKPIGRRGRRRRRGASELPPELANLLGAKRTRLRWHAYLMLWGGAILVGLLVGAGSGLLQSPLAEPGGPNPQMERQAVLDQPPSVGHQHWTSQADYQDASAAIDATFGFCHTGAGINCVVDGDTVWIQGQKVRVADIDAPETHEYRCSEEKIRGDRATQRLIELMNSGPVSLREIDRDEDAYGRKLRIVVVNGESVGDALVAEGLARYYEGGRKPWC